MEHPKLGKLTLEEFQPHKRSLLKFKEGSSGSFLVTRPFETRPYAADGRVITIRIIMNWDRRLLYNSKQEKSYKDLKSVSVHQTFQKFGDTVHIPPVNVPLYFE